MTQKKFEKAPKSKAAVAAGAEFNKNYIHYISKLVILEHGKSYQNSEVLKHSWRAKIPHTQQTADFLILHTKTYIRIQGSSNLTFLKELIQLICGYLSRYFNKVPDYGTSSEAYAKLMNELYWNFNYIQNIKRDQNILVKKPLRVNKPSKFTNGKATLQTSLENFNKTKGMMSAGRRDEKRYNR